MSGHQHQLELGDGTQLADHLAIDRGSALGLQHRFVEVEQRLGCQRDLLHLRRWWRRRWRRWWRRWWRRRRYCGRGLGHQIGFTFDDGHGRGPVARPPAQRVVDSRLAAIGATAPNVGIGSSVTEQHITAILGIGLTKRRRAERRSGGARDDACDQTNFHHFHPFARVVEAYRFVLARNGSCSRSVGKIRLPGQYSTRFFGSPKLIAILCALRPALSHRYNGHDKIEFFQDETRSPLARSWRARQRTPLDDIVLSPAISA